MRSQVLIDTHCHLDVPDFDADRDAVVARARTAGVTRIIVPAIRPATFARTLALVDRYPEVRVALGLHPQAVPELGPEEKDMDALGRALAAPGVVAVGECGLDGRTADHPEQ